MEKIYYVYAFDIKDQMVTSALSCHDEKTAKWACRIAKNQVEAKNDVGGFVFGVAEFSKHNATLGTMNLGGMPDSVKIEYPTGFIAPLLARPNEDKKPEKSATTDERKND